MHGLRGDGEEVSTILRGFPLIDQPQVGFIDQGCVFQCVSAQQVNLFSHLLPLLFVEKKILVA